MKEQRYSIKGLDCPNCAAKIELAIQRMGGVEQATLDYAQGLLIVQGSAEQTHLQTLIDGLEEGVTLEKQSDDEDAASEKAESPIGEIVRLALAALLLGSTLLLPENLKLFAALASWLLAGYEVLFSSIKTLARFFVSLFKAPLVNPLDENMLMTIATIGAFALGEHAEGAMVMLLFGVGEMLQEMAVKRSRSSIEKLMRVKPDHANLVTEQGVTSVDPASVNVGDVLEIRPGERAPLDGIVLSGESAMDTKDMTGESLPRDVAPGSEVLSGYVNQSGLLRVRVSRPYAQSAVSRMLERIRDAAKGRAQTELFFTRFARVYTPIVVGLAALLALVPLLLGGDASVWIYRALSFLVISCPCALVLSVPLSYFCGIGAASKRGVLCKGGAALEQLARADAAALDKTGTLTLGKLSVSKILPADGIPQDELIALAATAESRSTHPVAQAVAALAEPLPMESIQEKAGRGVVCTIQGAQVLAGNQRLLREYGIDAPDASQTAVWIARDGQYLGRVELADTLHPEARATIEGLKKRGFAPVAMLSGDATPIAEAIAQSVGGMQVHAQLLPDQKVEQLKQLQSGHSIVYVGDGVNDAPCLLAADTGVAIGLSGSDSAIEAADVVLLSGSPKALLSAVDIARATRATVIQNVVFALAIKAAFLALAACGLIGMWFAVFADTGVALLCVLNALRLFYRKQRA